MRALSKSGRVQIKHETQDEGPDSRESWANWHVLAAWAF